jgi:hypothetical protein
VLVVVLAVQVEQVLHLLRLGHQLPVAVVVVAVAIKVAVQEDRAVVALVQTMQLVMLLLALQILAVVAVVDHIPMRLLLVVRVSLLFAMRILTPLQPLQQVHPQSLHLAVSEFMSGLLPAPSLSKEKSWHILQKLD